MDKQLIQKIVIFAAIAIGLVLIGYGVQKLVTRNNENLDPTQKLELQLRNLISENIENWDRYQKVTDEKYKKFGNDPTCPASTKGSEDFLSYEQKAKEGDVYALDLTNGAYVMYTPNYNQWDNAKISSLSVQDMRICSSGWLIPLHAYQDKVVWANATCDGVEQNQAAACQLIARIVLGYFASK